MSPGHLARAFKREMGLSLVDYRNRKRIDRFWDTLRRRGVSKGHSVVLTTLLLATVMLALLGFLGVAATRLVQVLPTYQDKAEALQQGFKNWLMSRGIEPDRVLSLDLLDPGRLLRLAAGFLSQVAKVLSQTLLLLLIVAFILAERGLRHAHQEVAAA